jgi:hypothetical protein
MTISVQTGLMQATEIAEQSALRQSSNGVRYTAFGENNLEAADLDRIVQAVPAAIAASLAKKAYYFVPLALIERPLVAHDASSEASALEDSEDTAEILGSATGAGTMIATTYTVELSDRAICHRNVRLSVPAGSSSDQEGGIDGVFISTRLLADRFALAFEFFINVAHAFVDVAGIPESFSELVWTQALSDVRGETSQDAWESRALSLVKSGYEGEKGRFRVDEKAKNEFLEAAFSDAVAIYQLSLAIDFDYAELRERDYPLLAPQALAERLRLIAKLFPPNAGYEFAVRYRRRNYR